jgi:hypothetical protein
MSNTSISWRLYNVQLPPSEPEVHCTVFLSNNQNSDLRIIEQSNCGLYSYLHSHQDERCAKNGNRGKEIRMSNYFSVNLNNNQSGLRFIEQSNCGIWSYLHSYN